MKKLISFLFLVLFSGHSFVCPQESAGPGLSLQNMQEILSALALQEKCMNDLLPESLKELKERIKLDKYANKLITTGNSDDIETREEEKARCIIAISETPEEIHGALSLTKAEFYEAIDIISSDLNEPGETQSKGYTALRKYTKSQNPLLKRFGIILKEIFDCKKSCDEQNKAMVKLNPVYSDFSTTTDSVIKCAECSWITNRSNMLNDHLDKINGIEEHTKKTKVKEDFLFELNTYYNDYQQRREEIYSFYNDLRKSLMAKIKATAGKNTRCKSDLLSKHTKLAISNSIKYVIFNNENNLPEFLFKKETAVDEKASHKTKQHKKPKPKGKGSKAKGKGKKHAHQKKKPQRKDRREQPTTQTKTSSSENYQQEEIHNIYSERCPNGQCGSCETCRRFAALYSKKHVDTNDEEYPKSQEQQTKIKDEEIIEDTDIFVLINNPSKNQKIRLYKLNREKEFTPERTKFIYHTRVTDMFDGTLENQLDTANHAFTRIVDNYLFDFGIKSTDPSKVDDERYFNIHLPGEIISNDGQEIKYGVFSYGFFKTKYKTTQCYHRYFTQKPKHLFIWEFIKEGYMRVHMSNLVNNLQI